MSLNAIILEPETGILLGWFSPPGRPKHPTDRSLTYDTSQNPMAGPYWFERMKADRTSSASPLTVAAIINRHKNGWACSASEHILDEARKAVKGG